MNFAARKGSTNYFVLRNDDLCFQSVTFLFAGVEFSLFFLGRRIWHSVASTIAARHFLPNKLCQMLYCRLNGNIGDRSFVTIICEENILKLFFQNFEHYTESCSIYSKSFLKFFIVESFYLFNAFHKNHRLHYTTFVNVSEFVYYHEERRK